MKYRIRHHLPSKDVWFYHTDAFSEAGDYIQFVDAKTGMTKLVPRMACSIEVVE